MSNLYVIGIGPGGEEELTRARSKPFRPATWVGYHTYLGFLAGRHQDKILLATGMTRERSAAGSPGPGGGGVSWGWSPAGTGVYGLAAGIGACAGVPRRHNRSGPRRDRGHRGGGPAGRALATTSPW